MSTAEAELFDASQFDYRDVDGHKVEKVTIRISGSYEVSGAHELERWKAVTLGEFMHGSELMLQCIGRDHRITQDEDGGEHLSETIKLQVHTVTPE